MSNNKLDVIAAQLARQRSRRALLRSAGAAFSASALGVIGLSHASAQDATPGASPAAGCSTTTAAENAKIARRWTEDMLTGRNLSVLDEITSPDIVWDAGSFPVLHGRAAVKGMFDQILTAFPDGTYSVDQVVAENDLVAVRWSAEGTHNGTFFGVPATGTHVSFTGINIYRIACGQIVEGASETDSVAIFQQVGVLPATPAAEAQPSPVASPALLASPAAPCASTSEAENEAMARKYFDAWDKGDASAFADLLAPGMVHHWGQGADTTGLAAYQHQVNQFFTAFPDLAFTIAEVFGKNDLVVVRWTATGTQKGEFFGIAPTGKVATWTGTNIFRFACGQIVESWSETDGLGLRQQLGALPDTLMPAASTPAA